MEGNTCHTLALEVLHQHLGPIVVVIRCTAGNLVETVAAEIAEIGGVAAIKVAVVLRSHIATAAPGLVADAEILYAPRFLPAV